MSPSQRRKSAARSSERPPACRCAHSGSVFTTKDTKSTKGSENETPDATLQSGDVEADQQSGLDAGELHVCQQLRLVDACARHCPYVDSSRPGPSSRWTSMANQSPGSIAHRIPSFVSFVLFVVKSARCLSRANMLLTGFLLPGKERVPARIRPLRVTTIAAFLRSGRTGLLPF